MDTRAMLPQSFSRLAPVASAPSAAHAGPIDVLAARFPVVRRLVGEESFRVMARRYAASEPARSPIFRDYGEAFPRFLRSQGSSASVEYVADIAELENARGKACRAAHARPVGSQAIAATLRLGQIEEPCPVLHPSVHLVASRFPIVTIWESNRCGGGTGMIERWRAESAIVARPFLDVEVRRLPPGGHAFIDALSRGGSVSSAAAAGSAAADDFDTVANLLLVIEADIGIGFRDRRRASGSRTGKRVAS